MGYVETNLVQDPRFDFKFREHIKHGEQLAQAALASEILVCEVAHIPDNDIPLYCGRSQYPRFKYKDLVPSQDIVKRFVSNELNLWADLLHHLECVRTVLAKTEAEGCNLVDLCIHTHLGLSVCMRRGVSLKGAPPPHLSIYGGGPLKLSYCSGVFC